MAEMSVCSCARHQNTDLRENVLVEVRLQRGHLDTKNTLALGREIIEHVALEPAEHQILELLVQLLDLRLVVRVREVELVRERDYNGLMSIEKVVYMRKELTLLRHQEVHEREQLLDVVLQRCARE